jgi:hypothetical protein
VAFGCGVASIVLFMADVAALAVGALRPESMRAAPELALALTDFSFLAIATAAFLTAGVFLAFAVLALVEGVLWPRWLGWLAVAAAAACSLRVGSLFSSAGPFAPGGALGFWLPVVAFVGWVFVGSVVLARRTRT